MPSSSLMRARSAAALVAIGALLVACGGGNNGTEAAAPVQTGNSSSADAGIGITPDSVTVGTVTTLTGPVPGLFQGAAYGMDAWAAMANAQGGISGRQIKVKVGDDGMTCNQNVTVTESLIPKVFALVGGFSTNDGCSAEEIGESGIPDLGFALDPKAQALQNQFSPQPLPPGYRTGSFEYFKQKFPGLETKAGALYGNSAGGVAQYQNQKKALESVGYKFVYERAHALTETDFTSDILRMKSAGVQFLYLNNEDVGSQARIVNAAAQQDWHPEVITSSGMYDPNWFKLMTPGINTDNLFIEMPYAMFLGEDRSTTKGVDEYLTWLEKSHPGAKPDLYGAYAFAAGKMFGEALKAAGPNPTRQGLLKAVASMHQFDADGLMSPADVGNKKPPECWLLVTVNDGAFVRTLPKDKGFTCEPAGFFYAKQ